MDQVTEQSPQEVKTYSMPLGTKFLIAVALGASFWLGNITKKSTAPEAFRDGVSSGVFVVSSLVNSGQTNIPYNFIVDRSYEVKDFRKYKQ
jgi:hypothetical protein